MSFSNKNILSSNAPSPYGEAAHSVSSSLQAAAQRICLSEPNFAAVKDTIRLYPPEFTNAVELLSKRPKPWLHEFRRGIFEIDHPVHQTSGGAHDIVDAIRERQPTEPWNGDWIVPALQNRTPILEIATTIHVGICNTLRKVSFSDTVAVYLSYPSFLQQIILAAIHVRDQLASFHEAANRLSALHSLSKMLPDHQLLGQWIVSSAIEVTSSSTTMLIHSFIHPIKEQFIQRGNNFTHLTQSLVLCESFFHSQITFQDDLNWNTLFAIDLSLGGQIKKAPELLARSKTLAVKDLFRAVTLPDYISNTGRAKDIGREWLKFCSDIKACLCISGMIHLVMRLAEHFLRLGNIHSATAIGLALWNSNPRPTTDWWAWAFINPQDNFAGSENYDHCSLPYMNRRFMALQKSQSSEEGLRRFFDFLPSLWAELEPKTERSAREWSLTIAEFCTHNLPPSRPRVCTVNDNNTSRQKRKAPIANEIADMKTKRLRNKRNHAFEDGIASCEDENLPSNAPAGSAHSQVTLFAPEGISKMVEQASKKLSHPEHKLVENTPVGTVMEAYRQYLASFRYLSPSIHPQSHHMGDRTEHTSLSRKVSTEKLRPLITLNASNNAESQLKYDSPRDRELRICSAEAGRSQSLSFSLKPSPTPLIETPMGIGADMQRTSLPSISRILDFITPLQTTSVSHPEQASLHSSLDASHESPTGQFHSTSGARHDCSRVSRSSVLENQEHVVGNNGKLLLNSEQAEGPKLSTPLPKSSSCMIDNRQPPSSQAGELSSSLERAPMTCGNITPPKLSSECGKKGKTRTPRVPSGEDDIDEADPLCLRPDSNAPPSELTWNDPPIRELLPAASPKRNDQSHNRLSWLAEMALAVHDSPKAAVDTFIERA